MGITFSDPDVDTDENTIQLAALTPTDNAVIIGNGTAWTVESGSTFRASVGLAIGTDVQAYDADLLTWAGVTPGTGIATALAVNVGTAGAPVINGGALGTPSSGTLTSATGLPVSTGISGLGTGVADFLATPSSANLKTAITDETGSGSLVFATSPTLVTPVLGVASATTINKVALTAPATGSTLTIADGKTLTASNTLTLTATDGSTLAIGAGGTLASAAYKATGTSGSTVPLCNTQNTFVDGQGISAATQNNVVTRVNGISLGQATGQIISRSGSNWLIGADSTSATHINFYTDNGNFVSAGSISSSSSTTSYNTTSDVRLKRDIEDAKYDPAWVRSLRVRSFAFHAEPNVRHVGFIAQELALVAPDAVTPGDGDMTKGPSDEGFRSAGVDPSKLIYRLLMEVQELRRRLDLVEGFAAQ